MAIYVGLDLEPILLSHHMLISKEIEEPLEQDCIQLTTDMLEMRGHSDKLVKPRPQNLIDGSSSGWFCSSFTINFETPKDISSLCIHSGHPRPQKMEIRTYQMIPSSYKPFPSVPIHSPSLSHSLSKGHMSIDSEHSELSKEPLVFTFSMRETFKWQELALTSLSVGKIEVKCLNNFVDIADDSCFIKQIKLKGRNVPWFDLYEEYVLCSNIKAVKVGMVVDVSEHEAPFDSRRGVVYKIFGSSAEIKDDRARVRLPGEMWEGFVSDLTVCLDIEEAQQEIEKETQRRKAEHERLLMEQRAKEEEERKRLVTILEPVFSSLLTQIETQNALILEQQKHIETLNAELEEIRSDQIHKDQLLDEDKEKRFEWMGQQDSLIKETQRSIQCVSNSLVSHVSTISAQIDKLLVSDEGLKKHLEGVDLKTKELASRRGEEQKIIEITKEKTEKRMKSMEVTIFEIQQESE
ncbi:hypothetical protein ADUPG1_005042, partial [Aduncisulcus paluster]